jgi:hypothetical protein
MIKKLSYSYILLSLLLVGCNDGKMPEQKALEKDILEFSRVIWAKGDMTRKSTDAAALAEQKLSEIKGRNLDKWTCTKTGMACTTNDKKIEYQISLYPDKPFSANAYEGDKLTFKGKVTRIDTGIGSATVWVIINSETDAVVTAK